MRGRDQLLTRGSREMGTGVDERAWWKAEGLKSPQDRLQRENAKLKMELEGLRYDRLHLAQYHQLLEEKKDEVFDERRINLLKAQVMQLERQVVLLSEGLSSQMYRCLEVENAVETLTDRLRRVVSSKRLQAIAPVLLSVARRAVSCHTAGELAETPGLPQAQSALSGTGDDSDGIQLRPGPLMLHKPPPPPQRSMLSVDTPAAEVSVARAQLTQLIEMCTDVRQKLLRNNK
ncbi:hypothetical protein JZ751_001798, partial [Albula glossodonta]